MSNLAAAGLVLGALITYYIVVLILAVSGNGIGKYKGAEKELAIKAISDVEYLVDDKLRWAYTFHVDEVRPTTPDEVMQYCIPNDGEVTNSPDNPRFYTVTITTGETINPHKKLLLLTVATHSGRIKMALITSASRRPLVFCDSYKYSS